MTVNFIPEMTGQQLRLLRGEHSMLKEYWRKFFQNQFLAGSLVMFAGAMVANLGNYLYHLLMGRMLGPEGYGNLESVISIIYLLFIFISTLSLVITKFVASLKGRKDLKGISYLFHYFNRRLVIFGSLVALLIFLANPLMVSFLHLDSAVPIFLAGILFLISCLSMGNRAVLQGLLRFKEMAASHISETGLKVITAVILVLAGLHVNGAVLALLIGSLFAYILTAFFLRSLRKISPKKSDISQKTLVKFALPVFFSNLSFTSLFTIDVILVKHFFSSHEAGLYAALTVLGKIIFYATSSIPSVMFPMVADHHSQGKNYRRLLWTSFLLVFLICSGTVLVYFFLPSLMVLFLFGSDYLSVAPWLGWMAIFISFYSLAFLWINFFLSIEKTKATLLPLGAALTQIILISFFHRSLIQVIQISIIVSGFLLLGLMLYYGYGQTKASFRYRSRL